MFVNQIKQYYINMRQNESSIYEKTSQELCSCKDIPHSAPFFSPNSESESHMFAPKYKLHKFKTPKRKKGERSIHHETTLEVC